MSWLFGGLLFGPIDLIAAAGLGDRKLLQSLRRLGQKQDSFESCDELIEPEGIDSIRKGDRKFFVLAQDASEDELWKRILECLDSELADKADRDQTEYNSPAFSGPEILVKDSEGMELALFYAKKDVGNRDDYVWTLD